MFELQRLESIHSYDFVMMASYIAFNVPEAEYHFTPEQNRAAMLQRLSEYWDVKVTEEDVRTAVILMGRNLFELPTVVSTQVQRFIDCEAALTAGDASAFPPAYQKIVKDFLARETRVKELERLIPALFQAYVGDTQFTNAQYLIAAKAEIDGQHAFDEPTKQLTKALVEFCAKAPHKPRDLFWPKDHVLFPRTQQIPWVVHPEDHRFVGVSTVHGVLWITGMPIALSSWEDIVLAARMKEIQYLNSLEPAELRPALRLYVTETPNA